MESVQKGSSIQEAFNFYVKQMGEIFGIESKDKYSRVMIRLACMLRLRTKEDAGLLLKCPISNREKEILANVFALEQVETGINAWTRNPTYLPAVLINLAIFHDVKESFDIKIQHALEGAICLAEILSKYGEQEENRTSISPLNFNELAGFAVKNPSFFTLANFDLNQVQFNGSQVKVKDKSKERENKKENDKLKSEPSSLSKYTIGAGFGLLTGFILYKIRNQGNSSANLQLSGERFGII